MRGLVVDAVTLGEDDELGKDAPFAKLGAGDITWMGEISLGQSRPDVLDVLARKGLIPLATADGCEVQAIGSSPLVGGQLRRWTARIQFRKGALFRLTLSANAT